MSTLDPQAGDRRADPHDIADLLLYDIDLDDLTADQRIHLAETLLHLADVDARRDANLLALFKILSDENEQGAHDRELLRNILRYRVRVLPPLSHDNDGGLPGGGH